MAARTVLIAPDQRIPEGTSPIFVADLVDETGALITSPVVVTGSLYDAATGNTINGRDSFDLAPYIAAGQLSWTATPADTPMVSLTLKREAHRLVVRWTWASGTKHGAHEIEHYVVRMGPP